MKNDSFSEIFSYKNIRLAYTRLINSSTIDVKNYFGEELFKIDLRGNLKKLSNQLIEGTYIPSKPFKYSEPKKSNTQRVKTILSINDSLVYMAITNHIAEKMYDELNSTSKFVFGNILHENVKLGSKLLDDPTGYVGLFKIYVPLYNQFIDSGIKEVEENNQSCKLDTDITGFFDSIPHGSLILLLSDYDVNDSVLNLLGICLNTWSGTRDRLTPYVGIPQGPVASFFYANVILHGLDKIMIDCGASYYRYTDDMKIYSTQEGILYDLLITIDTYLKSYGLSINSSKTMIEKTNSDIEKESAKTLTNKSLSRIELNVDEINTLHSTYSTETDDDDKFYFLNLDKTNSIKVLKRRLYEVELRIRETNEVEENLGKNEILVEKSKLKNAYEWRYFAQLLVSNYDYKIKNNELLADIWLKCIDNYPNRAQHFSSNLSMINLSSKSVRILDDLKTKYRRFEWVVYHLNRALYQTLLNSDFKKSKKLFDELEGENSPLVRMSIYKNLLQSVSESDQIYDSLMYKIKNDSEPYLRQTLLDYVLSSENKQSLALNWFE